jgi:hypothetical protein
LSLESTVPQVTREVSVVCAYIQDTVDPLTAHEIDERGMMDPLQAERA